MVIKLLAIGDLVIATPALKRLREGFKNAEIDLLTTTWAAPAVIGNPNLDHIEIAKVEMFYSPSLSTIAGTFKLIRKLRKRNYDLTVIFHKHRAVIRFTRTLGISKKYYFDDHNSENSILLSETRHSAITAYELADLAIAGNGGESQPVPLLKDLEYCWHVKTDEAQEADKLLARLGVRTGEFIALFPGGGVNPSVTDTWRRWGTDKFSRLAQRLIEEHDVNILLLGGMSDRDIAAQIEREIPGGAHNLSGKINFRISAAIMQRARLVICNDTGPLHIAAALTVPVVGIFGPTGVGLKLPPGRNVFAATLNLPCSPCYFGVFQRCIFNNIRCMEELTVERVMQTVNAALESDS